MVVRVAVTVFMVMSVAGFAAIDRAIFIRTIFIRNMHHLSIAKGYRVRNLPASHY